MPPPLTDKPVAIASDHRGVALKARLSAWLVANGYGVNDCGTDSAAERVDVRVMQIIYALPPGGELFRVGQQVDAFIPAKPRTGARQ